MFLDLPGRVQQRPGRLAALRRKRAHAPPQLHGLVPPQGLPGQHPPPRVLEISAHRPSFQFHHFKSSGSRARPSVRAKYRAQRNT